jgi:NADPH:quinone reductase-like Zn-dependent oxidoreductase
LKAVVYTEYGSPGVLRISEIEKPSPKDGEVLIKVFAVAINDWDWSLVEGTTFVNRLLYGLFKPKKQIPGSDISGRIEAIGKNIRRFKIGDEVYGDLSGKWGGFAEYVCASESELEMKPSMMSFREAAAIPQAAMLAVQGLIDKGKIRPGQKLLINGAGGGVGTFALQIAKLNGVEVTAVDSAPKLAMLKSMGADEVVDYKQQDFTKNGRRYDLILDVKTNRSIFHYLRALSSDGSYITVGGSMSRLFQALLLGPLISLFLRKRIIIVALKPNKDLAYMNKQFEAGNIKPILDREFQLEEIRDAFELFRKGEHRGKVVINVFKCLSV